jgi:RHS repeat-associated protein
MATLSLVAGLAVSAEASTPQPTEAPVSQAPAKTADSSPSKDLVVPKARVSTRADKKADQESGSLDKKQPVTALMQATATGSPSLDMTIETRHYYGQDQVICWGMSGSLSFTQGKTYLACAVVQPRDAAGNATYFSASNTFRIIVKDGCSNTVSDETRYNIYSAGTNPPALGWVPVTSGLFAVPWDSSCASNWTVNVSFTGSTLDGTPVTANYTVQGDATPPPPPAPLPAEQTTGDANPWHSPQGDPVDSLTGAFNYRPDRHDLGYAARGGGLSLSRSYASDTQRSNRFGPGWSDSYDANLTVDATTGNITYHDPSGSTQLFERSGSSYTSPTGVRSALASITGGWSLTLKDQTVYRFDQNGQLISILDRNGQGSTLTWNTGKLSSVTGSGRSVTLSYNTAGQVAGATGSDGRTVTYQYTADGRLESFVDAEGFTTTYGYDANGLLASVKDPNNNFPIRSTYDPPTGRVVQQQDSDGKVTTFGWTQTGTDGRTGTATVTDPRGYTITDSYQNGYLVSQTDPEGKSTHFVWREDATLSSVTDRLGNTTLFSYDSQGNLTSRNGPDFKAETYTHNDKNDIAEVTDFRGNKTTYTYDTAGNPATVSRASITGGTSPIVTARFVYNADGTLQSSMDALNRTSQYAYNAQGDLTSTTTPEGRTTIYTVDAAGRVQSIVEPRGNITGANPDTYRTTLMWDKLDRVTSTINPLGHTSTTVFDPAGRVDHTINPKGGHTTYSYGTSGKPVAIQGPDPSVGPQRYTYDPNGNIATATSPADVTTTYTYTPGNALKTVSSTGTGTWTYGHDEAGRLTKATAPSGRSATLSRNAKGQVTNLNYSDGTPGVRYTYDLNGNRAALSDARGTTTYSYNAANLTASVTTSGTTFQYTYDEAGQLVSRKLPDGSVATQYGYDKDSRLTNVTSGASTLGSYTYDKTTGAVTTALPGGVTNTLQIDAAGRPVSVQALRGTTVLTKSQYTLDELGSPTRIMNADGTTDSYAYTPLNRLAAVCYNTTTCTPNTPTAAFRYSHSGDGNITSIAQPAGTTNYSYDSAGRVTSRTGLKGAATYQYDADGNTVSDGTANYTWNAASQLTKVTSGSATTDYSYDGDNHRVSTTIGRTTTTNSYDPLSGALVLEQGAGKTLRKYDHGLGLLSMTAGNSTSSYLTDAYGSVRGVASSTGTLSLGYAYNPYGDTRSTITGKNAPQNPLQFIGAYNNNPLYQIGARDYSASDGRFLSPDPAGIPGLGYTYTAGNPMVGIDPTGLSEQDWREVVNQISNGVAMVAGGVALVCTVAVICAPLAPAAGVVSLAASGVAILTSEETTSCLSGHGSCPQAIASAAIGAAAGKFGMGGKGAQSILRLSTSESWANAATLGKHFTKHGSDFGAESADDYARMASEFFQNGSASKLPTKIDADGTIRMFDPASNTFGAFAPSGQAKTFFKPTSNSYWDKQPGTIVP